MKHKIGIKINFYLFGSLTAGEVYEVNKEDNTVGIIAKGYKYPNVQTFKKLPKKTKDLNPELIEKLLPEVKKNCTTKFDESLDLSFQINNKQKKQQ